MTEIVKDQPNSPEPQSGNIQGQILQALTPLLGQIPPEIIAPIVQELIKGISKGAIDSVTASVEKFTPGLIKDFFQDLYPSQKKNLYERLELEKALTIKTIQSEDEDWVISKAFKEAIVWTPDIDSSQDSSGVQDSPTSPIRMIIFIILIGAYLEKLDSSQ
ncbi:hypothetical protein [Dapis sp. BLCC M229]|uniref:hypothetical protein n=1 Tax=Dapis sp. BLCC M229 TaxID=3400188 RepID=UPI003CF91F8F